MRVSLSHFARLQHDQREVERTLARYVFAFLLIARDPVRYRPLMPITWLEKLSFGGAAAVLMALGRIPTPVFALGMLDLLLGALFVAAWLKTPRDAS